MGSTIILTLLGLCGVAVLGGLIGSSDSDVPADVDDEADEDENQSPKQQEDDAIVLPEDDTAPTDYEVYQGTDDDDDIYLSADTDNPIMAIGGDGADTFTAEFPHRADDDRPFDVIITDFDPEEDILTLEVVEENMRTNAETPQDFSIEPAEDGSYVDIRVSVFDPDHGPDSAQDFVVRLDGVSEVSAESIYFADTESDESDGDDSGEQDSPPEADPIVIEGDVETLVEGGTREDDTIVVRHDTGKVVVSGGAGEDTVDARDFERSDEASLRIDGSEGDDTYLFSQGVNVSDDQYGGSDLYSMTVDPDTMHQQSPSTVVWDYNDRFELNIPAEFAQEVTIDNQPAHYDPNLGATVQRDDVYVGDTLVMRLINLDEEHRITLDSPAFTIVSPSLAA